MSAHEAGKRRAHGTNQIGIRASEEHTFRHRLGGRERAAMPMDRWGPSRPPTAAGQMRTVLRMCQEALWPNG